MLWFFFSSRRRHTRWTGDWSSDVCSSDLLMARAKDAEKKRDRSMAAYHHYELASAAVQIAIVLASASIITSMPALVWIAGALGALGVAFCVIGFFIPTAVHLF